MLPRAINHMTAPHMRYDAFLSLAERLGCVGVEFRNDLAEPLFSTDPAHLVAKRAASAGLRILALAELKAFNVWSDTKEDEARALINIARAAGAEAISLIPRCDGQGRGNGERQANLRLALRELLPHLRAAGLKGMVEPLGFETASLRQKSEAVDAIEALGAADTYKLVHDTFHHHLAGGGPIFAAHTGIVHISGVTDPALATSEMRDEHRVLVDSRDRLGTLNQIAALRDGGFNGPMSFEPFAPAVHALQNPETALVASFDFIESSMSEVMA